MMEKVSTQETRSYAGELRIEGDERESQVLKEYDGVYRALLRKGQEFRLELPPLFKNNFIDHGSLTSENRTNSATKTNLNTFLQFLERSELYELLVPCTSYSKGNGLLGCPLCFCGLVCWTVLLGSPNSQSFKNSCGFVF